MKIEEVTNPKELTQFIKFPIKLFKDIEAYVPPLIDFELSTLKKDKNPAFEQAETKYWVVKQNNKIVGRIAGIILNEEIANNKLVRFGWIDFIDDKEVSSLLLNTVADWGKSKGATKIHGPLGFTDLDFEGALIDGFDQMATQATIYNPEYYQSHYEYFGLKKAVDWVEFRGRVPENIPDRLKRVASLTEQRSKLKIVQFKKSSELKKYAPDFFKLLNKLYKKLYGYHELTESQKKYYTEQYFGLIRKEFIIIVVDENDKVVGMAIAFPSISKALKKAQGSLFPFGFIHLLKDFYFAKDVDIFLIGVYPEYSSTGIVAYILNDLLEKGKKHGIERYATGPMLEENANVLNLLRQFEEDRTAEIKRRCFIKSI